MALICSLLALASVAMVASYHEPNYNDREYYYLDAEWMFVYHPLDGTWKTYNIARLADLQQPDDPEGDGLSCPTVNDEPLAFGNWTVYRKWLYLSNDRAIDYNPTDGSYQVLQIDRVNITGPQDFNAPFDILTYGKMDFFMGKTVLNVGQDELLAFDPVTGEYWVRLFDSQAGLRRSGETALAGEPFPGKAIAAGQWPTSEFRGQQLIPLGGNMLMLFDQIQGRFWFREYNRLALGSEDVFKPGVKASGSWPDRVGAIWTYLGRDRLLAYFSDTCVYKAFNLDWSNVTNPVPGPPVVENNAGCASALVCDKYDTCTYCTADPLCGWCGKTSKCVRGLRDGPCDGNCETGWQSKICPGTPCRDHKTCTACVEDPFCGYCTTTGQCHDGTKEDPWLAECDDWRHFDCPMVKWGPPPTSPMVESPMSSPVARLGGRRFEH